MCRGTAQSSADSIGENANFKVLIRKTLKCVFLLGAAPLSGMVGKNIIDEVSAMTTINTWPGWQNVRQIGAGSFGRVYEIETQENGRIRKAALKVMSVPASPDDVQDIFDSGLAVTQEEATTYITSQIENVAQEFRVMAALRGNPNIVSFEDHMVIPHEGWPGADILIRMELLTPLTRYQHLHPLQEEDVIRLGVDMCRALEVCHDMVPPILHRDIKAANIMVDPGGRFKLGDFGVARVMEGTKSAHTKAGTEDYMAPEVLQMQGYRATADLYSLGILLYKMLNNNRSPFLPAAGSLTEDMHLQAKARRLRGEPLPPPQKGNPVLHAVILKALAFRPEDRYQTAREMRQALQTCQQERTAAGTVYGSIEKREITQNQTVGLPQNNINRPGMQSPGANPVYRGTTVRDGTVVLSDNQEFGQTGKRLVPAQPADKKKSPLPLIGIGVAAIVLILAVVLLTSGKKSGGGQSASSVPSQSSYTETGGGNSDSDTDTDAGDDKGTDTDTGTQTGAASQGSDAGTGTGTETEGGSDTPASTDELEIYTDSMALLVGDTMRLRLNTGEWTLDGNSKGITWTSSDPQVCSITDGTLKGIAPGRFTITAEYDGKTTDGEMSVLAVDEASGAKAWAEPASAEIEQGGEETLTVHFEGSLPERMGALAYDSAGMMLNLKWGSFTASNTCTLTIVDAFSEEKDGVVTVLVYDKDEGEPVMDHVIAAVRIPVTIKK